MQNGSGSRLYLTSSECEAFQFAAKTLPGEIRTFCETLRYSGMRISEALSLTKRSIDLEAESIIVKTLKKRQATSFRTIPVPSSLIDTLDLVHQIRSSKDLDLKLWSWSRTTAWRKVKLAMSQSGMIEGDHCCPKGLRHAYGVTAISKGVPLNMLSKWMGHSTMEVTSIYANAMGEEQREIAMKMWSRESAKNY